MFRVQILMSTYNGEKFLREQIDSILSQTYDNIELLIRDDGSSDNTVGILQEYAEKYENVNVFCGQNLGAANSFFELLQCANEQCDYFALADQDDIWLPEKIAKAINKLQQGEKTHPLLYCSRYVLVNELLEEMQMSIKQIDIRPSFGNALVENCAAGCTFVFTRELWFKLKEYTPMNAIMHDWWIYLVATFFGSVIFDHAGYILYRQHSSNTIGARNTYIKEFKHRLSKFHSNKGKILRQITEFQTAYDKNAEAVLLTRMVNYKNNIAMRLSIVKSNEVYRQRKFDSIIFKFLFLIGRV